VVGDAVGRDMMAPLERVLAVVAAHLRMSEWLPAREVVRPRPGAPLRREAC
jgi:hypothetical protein